MDAARCVGVCDGVAKLWINDMGLSSDRAFLSTAKLDKLGVAGSGDAVFTDDPRLGTAVNAGKRRRLERTGLSESCD